MCTVFSFAFYDLGSAQCWEESLILSRFCRLYDILGASKIVYKKRGMDALNTQQKEAVCHTEGALLVIAGAGAGKTRVITERILHLIQSGVAPEEILAVTFTNKAAKEMRGRVLGLLEKNLEINRPTRTSSEPFIATFHSLGVYILRENFRTVGIPRHFSIFDRSDSVRLVKAALKEVGYSLEQFEPKKILGSISRQKGNAVGRVEYQSVHASEFYPRVVSLVWEKYEKALHDEKALDFDDLLIKTVELLEQNKSILKKYQNMWKYLSVDEYQDTNGVQNKLTHLLANKHGNICVVGDIDQTIYTWRGANISNLLDFEHKYPNTKIIMLEENYRSTKNILDASNSVIEKNVNRPKKRLFTNGEIGEKISLFKGYDEADEARFVTEKSGELINRKVPPREIAVLYRVNFQSRVIEEFFLDCGIPYQVLGVRFFDRKEVKDVLSFLRLALNPESVADLKRVINVPPRGIGKVTLLRMVSGRESECTAAMQKRIGDFRALLSNIQNMALNQAPSETLRFILKGSGLKKYLRDGGEEGQERLLNIQELIALAAKYDRDTPLEGVEKLLTDAALATDQDTLIENTNSVKLMTVHAAKGLEFDYVFITGLEDGLFPHEMFEGLSGSSTRRDEEEERRLFYVALTRARKKIYLSYASVRNVFGARRINVQSEFIGDIPEELLVLENEAVEREKVIYLDLDDE